MSESSFPFEGGTAVATAPPPPAVGDLPPDLTDNNRSKLLLAGTFAGVVVLAVVGYFLFFAGGSDPAPPAGPAKSGTPAVVPSTAPSAAPAEVAPRIKAKNFGRDPFKALIVAPVDSAGAAPGDTTGTTGTSTGATGSTSTPTGTTLGGTGTTTGTTTPTVTAAHTFRVVKVAGDNSSVTVRLDGVDYTHLAAGDVFATFFKVVVIGGKVNGFQFGDEKFSVFGTKKLYIAS
jgi:hypothetical protein